MESVLIISNIEKHISYFKFMLSSININNITTLNNIKDSRKMIKDCDFDLIIVDSPLKDELGKNFSIEVKRKTTSQIIYCENIENFEKTCDELYKIGIMTLSKPFNRKLFSMLLKSCYCSSISIKKLDKENKKLSKKLEEIKIIDRAKCLLISHLSMSEKEAHKYIEKQSMDHRLSKLDIATRILKTYES